MNREPTLNFFHYVTTSLNKNHFGLLFFSLLLTIGGSTVLAELGLIWIQELLILLNLLVLLSIVTGRWILRAGLGFSSCLCFPRSSPPSWR